MQRSDYDFDVITGPSTPVIMPAPQPARPAEPARPEREAPQGGGAQAQGQAASLDRGVASRESRAA